MHGANWSVSYTVFKGIFFIQIMQETETSDFLKSFDFSFRGMGCKI